MSDPRRELLPADLRDWAELLARHHRSLRRPYATGRPTVEAEDAADDREWERSLMSVQGHLTGCRKK